MSGSSVAEPDDFDQLVTATRFQLKFFLRTYRFVGLALFTLALSLINPATAAYEGEAAVRAASTLPHFLASGLSNIGLEVALVAAFFGGDAISTDFGSSTGYFSLVQPVRRSVLLAGRYLAAFLATLAVSLIYIATVYATATAVYGSLPLSTLSALGLTVLVIAAYLALAFFFSSLFRRPVVSTIATVLLLWLAFPVITTFVQVANIEPWFMPDYAALTVTQSLESLPHHSSLVVQTGNVTLTVQQYYPFLAEGAAVLIGTTVAFLGLSMLLYRFKQVTA